MYTVKRFKAGEAVVTEDGARLGEFSQTACYAIVDERGLCAVRNHKALFFSGRRRAESLCQMMNGTYYEIN